MSAVSRRAFLAAAAATGVSRGARFRERVGLEIYSLRREMKSDVPGTLALIHRLGFDEVEVPEFYGLGAAGLRRALDRAGLRTTAMVAQYEQLTKDIASVEADAKALGAIWVLFPWIPHQGAITAAEIQRGSAEMNSWAKRLAGAGLRFAYHPHGYEFQPAGSGTLFDTLMKETDAATVFFEMDTFWIAVPGQDCVRLLERYPRRFRLMHLKDLRRGAKTGSLSGLAPDEDSVAVGTGALPWPEILRAAKKVGVEGYYIEDESPAARAQIPSSLRYLQSLEL